MGYKNKIFNLLVNSFVSHLNKPSKIKSKIYEKVIPVYEIMNGSDYKFYCPNDLTRWRAETFFTKEPETIEWINSFQQNDILFDIGANVGLYSIYAAKKNISVISFEPESQNYAILNHNIFLNNVQDRVMGLNLALSDCDSLGFLYLPEFKGGAALNNLGETKNWKHEDFDPTFKQGILSFSLDSLMEKRSIPFPTHIKIDVDGIEAKIIKGAIATLKNPKLKSVLVELNEALKVDIETISLIESLGFKIHSKKQSVISENSEFSSAYNYIFLKEK